MKNEKVRKFETPETPKVRSNDKNNRNLRVALDKAGKYDDLITALKQDVAYFENEVKYLKATRKGFRIGYTNGFTDAKIATYEKLINLAKGKYLREEKKK